MLGKTWTRKGPSLESGPVLSGDLGDSPENGLRRFGREPHQPPEQGLVVDLPGLPGPRPMEQAKGLPRAIRGAPFKGVSAHR